MGRFKDLAIEDKCRIYAYCYGNVMMIAEYLNNEIKKVGGDGRVTYLEVKEDLEGEDEEVIKKLREALMIRFDYLIKRNLGQGNSMYDLKVIERMHPEYRPVDRGSAVKIDSLNITLGHIKSAEEKIKKLKEIKVKEIEVEDNAEEKEDRDS